MEVLYEIRDAFFWWAGVWATITFANHGVRNFLRKRRLQHGFLTFAASRLNDDEEQDEEPATDTDTTEEHGQTDTAQ